MTRTLIVVASVALASCAYQPYLPTAPSPVKETIQPTAIHQVSVTAGIPDFNSASSTITVNAISTTGSFGYGVVRCRADQGRIEPAELVFAPDVARPTGVRLSRVLGQTRVTCESETASDSVVVDLTPWRLNVSTVAERRYYDEWINGIVSDTELHFIPEQRLNVPFTLGVINFGDGSPIEQLIGDYPGALTTRIHRYRSGVYVITAALYWNGGVDERRIVLTRRNCEPSIPSRCEQTWRFQ